MRDRYSKNYLTVSVNGELGAFFLLPGGKHAQIASEAQLDCLFREVFGQYTSCASSMKVLRGHHPRSIFPR